LRVKASDTIKVDGYVPHELMALAILVEYEVGIPTQQRIQNNAQTILQSTAATGKTTTTVSLGVSVYIPFDGEGVIMCNSSSEQRVLSPRDFADREREFDDLAVTTSLRGNDAWTILAPKVVYMDLGGDSLSIQEDAAQPKQRGNRVSRARKASDDDDRDRDEDEDGNVAELGGRDHVTVGFDLAIKDTISRKLICQEYWVPATGSAGLRRLDDIDDVDDEDDDRPDRGAKRRLSLKPSIRESMEMPRDDDFRDRRQRFQLPVSESIVAGDSESSNLMLDPHLYSARQQGGMVSAEKSGFLGSMYDDMEATDAQFTIPRDRGSLLAQSLQARLMDRGVSSAAGVVQDTYDDHDTQSRRQRYASERRFRAQFSTVRMQGGVVTSRPSTAPDQHSRNLSRAARSRLSSHGFDGALVDSLGNARGRAPSSGGHVDLTIEAADEYSMHDVTVQFAGYRIGRADSAGRAVEGTYPAPKSVYFSYQFYSCKATRTEIMRLLSADHGGVSVLCRAEAHARDEAPLALRHIVDCSDGSPTEAYDFAEYLAHGALFIDVWDADSLMLLGTCCVPLRRIMRQGQTLARCAIECDVVDPETEARVVGGIATTHITEGSSASGAVVGSVHLILSNRGEKGRKGSSRSSAETKAASIPGLNWRAHNESNAMHFAKGAADLESKQSRSRPKISVRARPLSENAPELSRALQDHRFGDARDDDRGNGASSASMRSLTANRGADGGRVLTYDDVANLFKRFQGESKGTVQYAGALMTLLDVPSWSASVRKLIKAYKLAGGEKGFERVRENTMPLFGFTNLTPHHYCLR